MLDDNYKVDKYIKIAMLYLQDDESVNAETYINRASLLINDDTDGALKLQHKARAPARGPGARHIARAPSARRAAGVLRADPRLEAEVPWGGDALLPALAADYPPVRLEDDLRG